MKQETQDAGHGCMRYSIQILRPHFTDTILSNFSALDISFSPSYTAKSGWTVQFVFPSFTSGETRVITYTVDGWVPISRLDGFSAYEMSADKAAPQAPNATQNQTQQPANMTTNTAMNDSKNAIDAAIRAIANANGKDVSAAVAKLAEAERAYQSGNYPLALELANSAKSLAGTAPPQSATQQANGTGTGTTPPAWVNARFLLLLLGVLGAIVVLAALIFIYLRRRPYKKKPKL